MSPPIGWGTALYKTPLLLFISLQYFCLCWHCKYHFLGIQAQLRAAPLPVFSRDVEAALQGDGPTRLWNTMIHEVAQYYLHNFPHFKDQGCYRIIGSRMYNRYPSIAMEGTHAWVGIFWSCEIKCNINCIVYITLACCCVFVSVSSVEFLL